MNKNEIIDGYYSPSLSEIGQQNNQTSIERTELNSPRHYANLVMGGLHQAIGVSMGLADPTLNPSLRSLSDSLTDAQAYSNFVGSRPHLEYQGLNLGQGIYRLGDIIREYPNIKNNVTVLDCNEDDYQYGLWSNEQAINPVNIYSSYIKNAITMMISQYGFSDLQFWWTSCTDTQVFKLEREPAVRVFNIRSLIQEPPDVTSRRFKVFLEDADRHIFQTIYNNFGNFDVLITYSGYDKTTVQLQLKDWTDTINQYPAITYNYLGGVNSPLLGDSALFEKHHNAIGGVLDIIPEMKNLNNLYSNEKIYSNDYRDVLAESRMYMTPQELRDQNQANGNVQEYTPF